MSLRWNPLERGSVNRRRGAATASGRIRGRRRRLGLESLEDRVVLSTSIPLNATTWTPIGPAGIGGTTGYMGAGGPSSGRVTGIGVLPGDASTYYVATDGGGIWKTTDAGGSWTPLTDDQATLAIGSIAVAPSNTNVIYAGTGVPNDTSGMGYGQGVLKSTDGGNSWTLLGTDDAQGNPQFFRRAIGKIVVASGDPNTVYAAVSTPDSNGLSGNTGIWKTTDGGATWTDTTTGLSTTDQFTDVAIDPLDKNTVFAAIGDVGGSAKNGVYVSHDGGNTWLPAGNFPTGPNEGVIKLAVGDGATTIYASIATTGSGTLYALEKSVDGGKTWSSVPGTPNFLGNPPMDQVGQASMLAIEPGSPNVIIAGGGVDYSTPAAFNPNQVIESVDGGATWIDLTKGTNGVSPHAGQHVAIFDGKGNLLIGNDGGVWELPGGTATANNIPWDDLNANLQITNFNSLALDPTNANIAYGGAAANGVDEFDDNTTWEQLLPGDAGQVQVGQNTVGVGTQTIYAETADTAFNFFNYLQSSSDGGKTWTSISGGLFNFGTTSDYPPFVVDPSNGQHILFGSEYLNESTNGGTSWRTINTPGFSGWTSTSAITSIGVGTGMIYAATADGQIYSTTNDGQTWAAHNIPKDQLGQYSQILVSQTNPLDVYVVSSAFDTANSKGHVFHTTNGGLTWQDLTGNLPDLPTWSIAVDTRANNSAIYVGNDSGVWASTDNGTTWAPFRTGMPDARVTSLDLNTSLNVLAAGTFGRGAFEIKASNAISVTVTPPTGGVEGADLGNGVIATFVNTTGPQPLDSYTATIDWGDGATTPQASIIDEGNGTLEVLGDHTYTEEGNFTITVSVQDKSGDLGHAVGTIAVADAPLDTTDGYTITGTAAQTFSGLVTTFVDENPYGTASDFTAQIIWGDGKTTAGRIVPDPNVADQFDVDGSNLYVAKGTYLVSVTVADKGGQSASSFGYADIAAAPIIPTGITLNSTEGAQFSGAVGSFVDTNPRDVASDYFALVDWGDGTGGIPSVSGASIRSGGGSFNLQGTHTYLEEGTYNVAVDVYDVPLDAMQSTITSRGTATQTTFAAFNPSFLTNDPNYTTSSFIGAIDWGDGTSANPDITLGTIVDNGDGTYSVQGTHTYATNGSHTATAYVLSSAIDTTINSVAKVGDAGLTATSTNIGATEGQPIPAGTVVATFKDGNPNSTLSDFTGTQTVINWGDTDSQGNPLTSIGTITAVGNNTYQVLGGHTYAEEGAYTVSVTINDVGGATVTTTATATVLDAPLSATGTTVTLAGGASAVAGQPFANALLATFTDQDTAAPLSDYSATIDWGDGTPSSPDVTKGVKAQADATTSGLLDILGGHTYKQSGNYTITITISDVGGSTAQVTSTVQVQDATLTATAKLVDSSGNPVAQISEGNAFNGQVATFQDANPYAAAGDFLASVDWGDGHQSPARIVASGPSGSFAVIGSNTYAEEGFNGQADTITVTIYDLFGASTTAYTTVTIVDAPLSIAAAPGGVVATEGAAFNATAANPVAILTDGNPNAPASDFTTTITWGDGQTSAGSLVALGNGQFAVLGSNTYAEEGTYPITVSVSDIGGSSATTTPGTLTATVQDAPLTAQAAGGPIVTLQGGTFSGPVATFSDADTAAPLSDFTATITWGDGAVSAGTIVPVGGGTFQVTGTHTFAVVGNFPVSVAINDKGGSATASATTASVIAPIGGATVSAAVSTNTQPTVSGTAQPGTVIQVLAESSAGGSPIVLGRALTDGTGHWTLTSPALADGTYALVGEMLDASGNVLQTVSLGTVTVDTTPPRVLGTIFDPGAQQLRVTFYDAGGMNPAALLNPANYVLTLPGKHGAYSVTGISLVPGATGSGQITAVVSYNLGRKLAKGDYVIQLNALGLTDLAGNTLVEKTFVAFPQTTNAPNPNYIAEFVVTGPAATTPTLYISKAERLAAARYVRKVQGKKAR